MHDLKIKPIGIGRADVYLDGELLKGITSYKLEGAVGEINRVTLTMLVKSGEADGPVDVTTIGDDSRVFRA